MRRALIVGVDDYPQSPLQGCGNDAQRVASLVRTHSSGSPNFDTRVLVSPPNSVTRSNLREAIHRLFETECEIAFLYFSGHGFVGSTDGQIVTHDAQMHDEGIPMTEILSLANKSPATNRIVMLDCCYSGNMGTPRTTDATVAQLAEGLTILTASRAAEVALERPGGGVFTNLVVAALDGGAADLCGRITPGSIYAYVDQALGAWDQRPIFKTNVTRFSSLRNVEPQVPLDTLRQPRGLLPWPGTRTPSRPDIRVHPPRQRPGPCRSLQGTTENGRCWLGRPGGRRAHVFRGYEFQALPTHRARSPLLAPRPRTQTVVPSGYDSRTFAWRPFARRVQPLQLTSIGDPSIGILHCCPPNPQSRLRTRQHLSRHRT